MRSFAWLFATMVLLTVGTGYVGRRALMRYLTQPRDPLGAPRLIHVPEGESPASLVRRLQREGLVRRNGFINFYAEHLVEPEALEAGEYQLNPGRTPLELLDLVERGQKHQHTVVLRPGATAREMGETLAAEALVSLDDFMRAVNNPTLAQQLGVEGPSLEGFLYPDVWSLPRYLSAETIVAKLVQRFLEHAPDLELGSERLGLTPYQVIIMASLVEKGPISPNERHLYAALLLERLQKGYALESKAADEYGRRQPNAPARASRDPWNTTARIGLPKTPIGSPGHASIRATLEPADTEPLYMIRSGGGRHDFCPDEACYVRLFSRLNHGQQPSFPKREQRDL